MKKIIAFVSIILIFNTGLSQRISSNDLDHFLKVDNSVYEKEILKKGFVFDTINEYTNNGKLYYFKKFENEKTGEWIERFFWDKSKVQINYTFIGVEDRKNTHYKAFKNDFLFNEYSLIHEAKTDDPGYYAKNDIKSTFKKSDGTRVTLLNTFSTRHFSNSDKRDDYTHWITIVLFKD